MIPAFLSVDVEPEPFQISRVAPPDWDGFNVMIGILDRLRRELAILHNEPPRFGWYVRTDPQVASVYGRPDHALRAHARQVDHLLGQGDYLGVHMHPLRWSESANVWIHDFGDADWLGHCTRFSLDALGEWMGSPARRFRSGAGFINDAILEAAEERGVTVELTLEPVDSWGLRTRMVGSGVDESPMVGPYTDCSAAPRVAYRPSRANFRVADPSGRKLVMIPISSYARPGAPAGPLYIPVPWPNPQSFWDLVDRESRAMERPYVSFGVRTDRDGTTPLGLVRQILTALPGHPIARRLRFMDPLEVAPQLVA